MSTDAVWVLDDDDAICWVLERALQRAGLPCRLFQQAEALLRALETHPPAALFCDIRMPDCDGLTLLSQLRARFADLPVIIMTAHSDLDAAVNAYQRGAFDYLPKPFDLDEAVALARRAIAHTQTRTTTPTPAAPLPDLIGEAPAMQHVFRSIGRLSRSAVNVLITGESGTGKELVAKALHRHSPRRQQPFIALNMAAIPATLIEAELFGYEKGAFTGATQSQPGRFEQADGGTLFLDEVGDMPLDIQTRLLRVLAEGQFWRVGGQRPQTVDVRVIAATHQNLTERVRQGAFREDLFHRLNVIRLTLPPLRERPEDIPLLVRHFLLRAASELDVAPKTLHPAAEQRLVRCRWPGNVRQLENVCRWLTAMAPGQTIYVHDLPAELQETTPTASDDAGMNRWTKPLAEWAAQQLAQGQMLSQAADELEKVLLHAALQHTRGHKQQAAQLLGWGRNTLTRKLHKYPWDGEDTESVKTRAEE